MAVLPPQVPQAPMQAAPAAGPPQAAQAGNFDQLRQGWNQFFQKPETISALLQFGATLLTPGGNIGTALSSGAAAAGRTMMARGQLAHQAGQREAANRQIAVSERNATAGETRAKASERQASAAERRAAAGEKIAGRKEDRADKALQLDERRLQEYLIPSLAKGASKQRMTMKERLATTVYKKWSDLVSMRIEEVPEGETASSWITKKTMEELDGLEGRIKPANAAAAEAIVEPEDPSLLNRLSFGLLGDPGGQVQQVGATDTTGQLPPEAPATAPPVQAGPQAAGASSGGVQVQQNGLPSPETITDQQWMQIALDPQALEEAKLAFGENIVQRRLMVAQQRHRGSSIGVMQRNQGQ